jgi:hypothetical protein
MKRIGIAIAQTAPGVDTWVVIGGPTNEVGSLVDQVRSLPAGDQIVQIMATNVAGGILKRIKCKVEFEKSPKSKAK